MKLDRRAMANRIRRFRDAEGLTQEAAAMRTGIPIDKYRSIEAGKSADATDFGLLHAIASAYGRPLDDWLCEGDLPPPTLLELVPPVLIFENPGVPTSKEIRAAIEAFRAEVNTMHLDWVRARKKEARLGKEGRQKKGRNGAWSGGDK